MKDDDRITINDLSGALTLPLISELLAENKNIDGIRFLFQVFMALYDSGRGVRAFD